MEWIKFTIRGLIIIVLQVILFDRIQIQGWGYPMVYILLLLNLPIQIPRWAEMIIGMLVGLVIDVCNNSLGVHMAACVAISFARPILLKKSVQDIERIKGEIHSHSIGLAEYIKCAIILVVLHHLAVFALEAWSMQNWWLVLLHTLISSVLTIIILVVYEIARR